MLVGLRREAARPAAQVADRLAGRRVDYPDYTRAERCGLHTFRPVIETVNSQLTAMGITHLHVHSITSLETNVHASLFALACLTMN